MKNKIHIFTLLILSLFLFSCSPFLSQKGKVYLVNIGLDYKNSNEEWILEGPINDAVTLNQAFREIYSIHNIECESYLMLSKGEKASLKDGDLYPTRENIINTIKDINTTKNDLLILTFSGHGTFDENGYYLVTGKKNEDNIVEDMLLSLETLSAVLKEKEGECVVILDACFSGGLDLSEYREKNIIEAFTRASEKRGKGSVVALLSSKNNETSNDYAINLSDGSKKNFGLLSFLVFNTLGWNLNSTDKNYVNGVEVRGALMPNALGREKGVSVEDLFDGIISYINSSKVKIPQHPLITSERTKTWLIPK